MPQNPKTPKPQNPYRCQILSNFFAKINKGDLLSTQKCAVSRFYYSLIAFMIFIPLCLRASCPSSVTAFLRCVRYSLRTQFGKASTPVLYLPFVRSLKKLVITLALASPFLFRMMSRNSVNSISIEPSSSTILTRFSTSSYDATKPRPISGPLISSTPIEPELSSSKLLKHSLSRRICLIDSFAKWLDTDVETY